MLACRYNTKEFSPFTSGGKRIKPALASDWQVNAGGFQCSTDVLNLHSTSLNQTIYDVDVSDFFEFMKRENVTMNGDKIVGTFAIGQERVLRKEADYNAIMATVTERKSTTIAKEDMILGHEYETVCGSTFIFAGTRYFIKSITDKNGIRTTKNKKYYLSYSEGSEYLHRTIADVTSKKVVKDLGFKKDKEFLDKRIDAYIKQQKILYSSETLEKVDFELIWEETHEDLNSGFRQVLPDYIINSNGFIFQKGSGVYHKVEYKMLKENDKGILVTVYDNKINYDYYDNRTALSEYKSVEPKWVLK